MVTEPQPLVPQTIAPKRPAEGRWMLWCGILTAILGIVVYALVLGAGRIHHVPWYTPALATLGLFLVLISVRQRIGIWRILALLLVGTVTCLEWWFLLFNSTLPAYNGPVSVGQRFPEFTASLANGSPFSQNNLVGDRDTVLVFFRGHW